MLSTMSPLSWPRLFFRYGNIFCRYAWIWISGWFDVTYTRQHLRRQHGDEDDSSDSLGWRCVLSHALVSKSSAAASLSRRSLRTERRYRGPLSTRVPHAIRPSLDEVRRKWESHLGLGLCSIEDSHSSYLGLAIAKHKRERGAQDAEGLIGISGIDRVLGRSVQLPGAELVRGASRSWTRTFRRRKRRRFRVNLQRSFGHGKVWDVSEDRRWMVLID